MPGSLFLKKHLMWFLSDIWGSASGLGAGRKIWFSPLLLCAQSMWVWALHLGGKVPNLRHSDRPTLPVISCWARPGQKSKGSKIHPSEPGIARYTSCRTNLHSIRCLDDLSKDLLPRSWDNWESWNASTMTVVISCSWGALGDLLFVPRLQEVWHCTSQPYFAVERTLRQ